MTQLQENTDKYQRALHFSFKFHYLVIMPAKERQQISFLGYSHFIFWIAFVITFISCMLKFFFLY